jgi:hypothetical protein
MRWLPGSHGILFLFLLKNRDFAITFEGGAVDVFDVANTLVARCRHHVHSGDPHQLHGVLSPPAIIYQDEWRSIQDLGGTLRSSADSSDDPMDPSDGHDLENGIRQGDISADHSGEGEAAEVKDEHKFEGSELFAGSPPHNTGYEYQEEITPRRPENSE